VRGRVKGRRRRDFLNVLAAGALSCQVVVKRRHRRTGTDEIVRVPCVAAPDGPEARCRQAHDSTGSLPHDLRPSHLPGAARLRSRAALSVKVEDNRSREAIKVDLDGLAAIPSGSATRGRARRLPRIQIVFTNLRDYAPAPHTSLRSILK
jgi:hypothetical protein